MYLAILRNHGRFGHIYWIRPVSTLADAIGTDGSTTIVWANPTYPDLIFTSDPSTGTIIFATSQT